MTQLSRRAFLLVLCGGGAIIAGGVFTWSWFRGDAESIVRAVVRRRIGFLYPDNKIVNAFSADYIASQKQHRNTLAKLSLIAVLLRIGSPYTLLKMGHPLRRLEDNIVSQFLLSTDFFQNNADESRIIKYVGFYDPGVRPCRNPFATQASKS